MNGKLINKTIDSIGAIITVICGMLTSLGVSFFSVLIFSGFFLNFTNEVHISNKHILVDYYRLLEYLCSYSSGHLHFRFLPMSRTASEHFAEVRVLVHYGMVITIIAFGLFLVLFRAKKKRNQLWELIPLYQELMLMLIVFISLIAISFQDSFLWFHYHFFDDNYWIFNPKTDPIILVLNDNFFLKYFICWTITMLLIFWGINVYTKYLIKLFIRTGKF